MNLDDLSKYIGDRISNLTTMSTFNQRPTLKAEFPYLVYKFERCQYNVRNRQDWYLELDYWDDSNNDSNIIAESIQVRDGISGVIGLDKSTQSEAEGFYKCNIDSEGVIEDPEKNIVRYNQRYVILNYTL